MNSVNSCRKASCLGVAHEVGDMYTMVCMTIGWKWCAQQESNTSDSRKLLEGVHHVTTEEQEPGKPLVQSCEPAADHIHRLTHL